MSDRPEDINLDELRELIKLLRESNVSEFEIQKADYRLRIKHGTVLESETISVPVRQGTPGNGQEQTSTSNAGSGGSNN